MLSFLKKSEKQTDISLLIQGPLNLECLKTIKSSQFQFKQIIYSTWKNQSAVYPDLEEFEMVIKDLPDTANIVNVANSYYQIYSTLAGLRQVKSKFYHQPHKYLTLFYPLAYCTLGASKSALIVFLLFCKDFISCEMLLRKAWRVLSLGLFFSLTLSV